MDLEAMLSSVQEPVKIFKGTTGTKISEVMLVVKLNKIN